MDCIVALLLFGNEQSTHDVFCHFPQSGGGGCGCRGAQHHQTALHPSSPCLSLVLGYHLAVGSSHLGVLLIVVVHC